MKTVSTYKRLESVDEIWTPEGVETLRIYMFKMMKKHNLHVPHPYDFEDMFQRSLLFLYEHLDRWDANKGSNLNTWCTDMLRYGWLHGVREMKWSKHHGTDPRYPLRDDRRLTSFGVFQSGDSELDMIAASDNVEFTVVERLEMEEQLADLPKEERVILRLLAEGYTMNDAAQVLGLTYDVVYQARNRLAKRLGCNRPVRYRKPNELTRDDKRAIIKMYAEPDQSYTSVARAFNVGRSTVGELVRGTRPNKGGWPRKPKTKAA